MQKYRTKGFWFVMVSGIVLLVLLILGQTMSFINYDFTVSLGLQEPVDDFATVGLGLPFLGAGIY